MQLENFELYLFVNFHPYLFKAMSILFPSVGWLWLVWKWHCGKFVLVVCVAHILDIFENWIENLHAFGIEKADFTYQSLVI